jgi:hypothetical protein
VCSLQEAVKANLPLQEMGPNWLSMVIYLGFKIWVDTTIEE